MVGRNIIRVDMFLTEGTFCNTHHVERISCSFTLLTWFINRGGRAHNLLTLHVDSTQEIYIFQAIAKKQVTKRTHIFSLEVKLGWWRY